MAKKLFDTTNQLSFMYPSSNSDDVVKLMEENEYGERLLTKLYWDYRHLYNPMARLSAEIETELVNARTEVPYQPTVGCDVSVTNQEKAPPVHRIYSSGDVYLKDISELSCFPLNQWITDEFSLNIVWIGLLKLSSSIRTTRTSQSDNDIERFQLLLDFLYYISKKRGIRPFYLQVLNTVWQTGN